MSKTNLETLSNVTEEERVRLFWISELKKLAFVKEIKDPMLEVLEKKGKISDNVKSQLKQHEKAVGNVVEYLQELTKSQFNRNGNIGGGIGGYAPQGASSRPGRGKRS